MTHSIEDYAARYQQMQQEELIRMYLSGGLVENAYQALISELEKRGVGLFDLYQATDLSKYKTRVIELKTEIETLSRHRDGLLIQVARLKEKQAARPSILSLFLQRKRLEEETRISDLEKKS